MICSMYDMFINLSPFVLKKIQKTVDPVAQLVEQCPFKALAEGSNPSWVTSFY